MSVIAQQLGDIRQAKVIDSSTVLLNDKSMKI